MEVINPDDRVVVPYRFEVQRQIEPEVTIGIGGPRAILAGDAATYSVALENLGNVDAPYTYFQLAIPEMGVNSWVYNLPFLEVSDNLRGAPSAAGRTEAAFARLESSVNVDGYNASAGYLFDEPAEGFTGFSFNVATYPGLKELAERQLADLRSKLYAIFPALEAAGALDDGPQGLNLLVPGLGDLFESYLLIPDPLAQAFIPFEFNVSAAATTMTRDEFVAHNLAEAGRLRGAVLADDDASPALVALAADEETWNGLFLASLEQSGLLRPAGGVPPLRETPAVVSLMATLASGILVGPAGQEVVSTGDLVDFFAQLREWYGHNPDLLAPSEPDIASAAVNNNWVPELPGFEDFDLGLSQKTHFESFRVFVPWVPFGARGAGLPPDVQNGDEVVGTVLRTPQIAEFDDLSGAGFQVQAEVARDLDLRTSSPPPSRRRSGGFTSAPMSGTGGPTGPIRGGWTWPTVSGFPPPGGRPISTPTARSRKSAIWWRTPISPAPSP